MNKIIVVFLLAIVSTFHANAQMATIHAKAVLEKEEDSTSRVRFTINGQSFGEKDTVIKVKLNVKGFDVCEAAGAGGSQKFLTRLKANEVYEITQGCCCALFSFKPINNANRGTVQIKNNTKRDLSLVVAEANFDTIKAAKAHTFFAYESAMCLWKPCSIVVTETAYLSDEYNYDQTKDRDYDKLWAEREKFVLGETWFLFLHGEKIEIEYLEATKSVRLKPLGYLTQAELETWQGK